MDAPFIASFNSTETVALIQFLVPNRERLRAKLRKLIADGPAHLGIITDFDNTLTTYRVNGISGPSTFKVLELSGLFSEEFKQRSVALSTHYRPLEKDQSIPHEDKFKLMDDWWTSTFSNYLDQGVLQSSLPEMLRRSNIRFRHGIDSLLSQCHSSGVSFTVVSAGLGNIVQLMLEEVARPTDFHVVSNFMRFSPEGVLSGFTTPMIHSLSKAVAMHSQPTRQNLIVMGDLPTDIAVVDQVDYEEAIFIGFANDERKGSLEGYVAQFDLIILHDGNLDAVQRLVQVVAGGAAEAPFAELLSSTE